MRRAQAMLEYVLAMTALLAVLGVLGTMVFYAKRQAYRAESIVISD